MSSSEINAALKAAEAAINDGHYKDALQHCKAALKADKKSSEALLLIGKAAYHLKEYEQSELAYRRALEAKPEMLEAWEGLAEVFATSGNIAGEIEANERLLEQTSEEDPRDRAARIRLADAYTRAGSLDQAVQQYLHVVSMEPVSSPERVDHLSSLADVMLRRDEAAVCDEVHQKLEGNAKSPKTTTGGFSEPTAGPRRTMSCLEVDVLAARAVQDSESGEASVFMVLSEIAERAPPALKYLPYREEYIRRCLLRIFHAPPRSTERQQFRLAALRECVSVLCHGGSCSPLPYEAAVWLLEEEEEIKGGQVSVGGQEVGGTQALAGGIQAGAEGHIGAGRQATVALAAENFSRRLIHQFPSHPTARVLLALMLRRHALHEDQPVSQIRRRQLENLLKSAMEDDSKIDCASGYKALAELQYENRNYEDAVQTSMRGLKWLQQRRERGHEALTQVALGLRLVLAKSLRRLDRLDEAERHFKSLAGWVTEGEAAFSEMCGSTPTSIHQQALRGIALVALARGDVSASRAQYERILGKAALGRGPAEHWAHADYGWLLYQNGDYQGARFQLEQALKVADEEGCAATDSQVGEHRYRLGEVYWKLKGRYRSDKQFAYHQFVEAAKVEGHAQAPALAALGRYLELVENRPDAAQKCFKRALAIDPSVDVAGDGICAYLIKSGRQDAAVALCRQVASRAQHAVWAWKRLGVLLLEQKQHAEAIPPLQAALRAKPTDASTWEALGAAYQPLGRLTAALKAYTRALELDPNRIYSLIQSGNLSLTLGDPLKALHRHEAALKLDSNHPAALLGAAEALASSASAYIHSGAVKAAGMELQKAAHLAKICVRKNGNLISAWKQLGDILLLARNAPFTTNTITKTTKSPASVPVAVLDWQERIKAVQNARSAYSKSLFLDPGASSAWHDVACTYYHECQLYRAHPSLLDENKLEKKVLNKLSAKAEWCLRGALRLAPSSPELWTALGVAATDRAVKEYALSRSLQLDPKSSTAWVALARLYIDANEPALAEQCLEQGRSQDPAVGLIWEAMAALAALASSNSYSANASFAAEKEKERAEYNHHAVGLGASAEGLLGFAEASLRNCLLTGKGVHSIGGLAGSVYAAAHRAKELEPLNPAALNTWGLACEVKEDFLGAIKAYKACLELIIVSSPGNDNTSSTVHHHGDTMRSGTPLVSGIKVNLARALCSAQQYNEALELYRELELEGILDFQPRALLSYAVVKWSTGDFNRAEVTAYKILEGNVDDGGTTAAAAVQLLMQLKIALGQPSAQVVQVLTDHLRHLIELKAPVEEMKKLWLMAVAAAVVGDEKDSKTLVDETISAAISWAQSNKPDLQNSDDASFIAQLHSHRQVASNLNLSKAVHLDPSAVDLRLSLAYAAGTGNSTYAATILRLLQNISIGPSTSSPDLLNIRLHIATAALLERGLSSGLSLIRQEARRASQALHAQPQNVNMWYITAVLAAQVAAGEKTFGGFKRALTCARCALSLINKERKTLSSSLEQAELNSGSGNGGTSDGNSVVTQTKKKESDKLNRLRELQHVRLLICISESLLHLPVQNGDNQEGNREQGEALQTARAALDLSSKLFFSFPSSSGVKVDALRQIARCFWKNGDISQAERFFRQAMEESSSKSGAIAAMELAACLRSYGRGNDAAEVLNEEASRLNNNILSSSTYSTYSTICTTNEGERMKNNAAGDRYQTSMLQQLLLQRTLALAHLDELEAAKICAESATPEEQGTSQSISTSRGLGLVAQGAVALQQALAVGPDTEAGAAFLAASRRYLTESLQKGQDGVVPRALLAHVEYSGTNRKKEERVQLHADQALLHADRPIAGELLNFLGTLQVSKALCAKALHSAPWNASWWAQMQESR